MLYRVTNTGDEERIVDFLAVFQPGETKEFNQEEMKHYQERNGVPLMSGVPQGWEVEFISEEAKAKAEGEEG